MLSYFICILQVIYLLLIYLPYSILVATFRKLTPRRWRWRKIQPNDVILITGAGSGIGRGLALKFAKLGARVVCWDINEEANEETIKMVLQVSSNSTDSKSKEKDAVVIPISFDGPIAKGYRVDVSKKEEIYATALQVLKDFGAITVLVNNAGIVSGKPFLETSDESMERTMQVNAISHFWTVKAFLPKMIAEKNGHIVTIASIAGYGGVNRLVDYCASKYAAVGFDEALRMEMETTHPYIKTTCVNPYFIDTGMFAGVKSKILPILKPEEVISKTLNGIMSGENLVFVPSFTLGFFLFVKSWIPVRVMSKLANAFGFHVAMNTFEAFRRSSTVGIRPHGAA